MRKALVIVTLAGATGAIAVAALLSNSGRAEPAEPLAAKLDVAPEPPRIRSNLPSVRTPTGAEVGGDRAMDEAPERPEAGLDRARAGARGEGGDRDGGGPGGWDRRGGDGRPMDAQEWAERWESRRSRWEEFRNRYDTDGDGELSDAEREAMREDMRQRWRDRMLERMTERFDLDGDGVLNDEERIEAEAEMAAREAEWRVRMLERFDSDGDGQISQQEEQAARDQFRRGRGGGGDDWQESVRRYDRDGDGELNLDESYAAYLDRFSQRERETFVRRYDAGQDGRVDAADLEGFLQRYQAQDPETDVNGDGVLNQFDVDRFRDMMMNNLNAEPVLPRSEEGRRFRDGGGSRDGGAPRERPAPEQNGDGGNDRP